MKRFLRKFLRKLVGSFDHSNNSIQIAINCKWGRLCEFQMPYETPSSTVNAKCISCVECSQSVRLIDSQSADIWKVLHSQRPFFLSNGAYQELNELKGQQDRPIRHDEPYDVINEVLTQSDPSLLELKRLLTLHHQGSRGYGFLRKAAEHAIAMYGTAWLHEPTAGSRESKIRDKLQQLVFQTTPKSHSNRSVVWRRFKDYALETKFKK